LDSHITDLQDVSKRPAIVLFDSCEAWEASDDRKALHHQTTGDIGNWRNRKVEVYSEKNVLTIKIELV